MSGPGSSSPFLQRALGYCLTGDVSEQVLLLFYGMGKNGKSTLVNVLLTLLGPYAMKATSELLMVTRSDRHPTERADLFRKRLVATIETSAGGRLNEVFVKEATGGDPIRARRMREDFWQFDPTHKIILATNHKPEIRGTDYAIWRRMRLVPFTVVIPPEERDGRLSEKLRAEYPGILAWLVQGCLQWQQKGLGEPEEVMQATEDYRHEMDVLEHFLEACCVLQASVSVKASLLYQAYHQWCETSGERSMSQRTFGLRLAERGFTTDRSTHGVRLWRGIGLLAVTQVTQGDAIFRLCRSKIFGCQRRFVRHLASPRPKKSRWTLSRLAETEVTQRKKATAGTSWRTLEHVFHLSQKGNRYG